VSKKNFIKYIALTGMSILTAQAAWSASPRHSQGNSVKSELADEPSSKKGTKKTSSPSSSGAVNRLGISIGGITWGSGLLTLEYDRMNFFKVPDWSAGVGVSFIEEGLLISPRALYWQHPSTFSGFYGGPQASIGFVNHNYYTDHNNHVGDSSFYLGVGGEGGWSYRFPKNYDLGGGVELLLTNYGIIGSLKVTAGMTF